MLNFFKKTPKESKITAPLQGTIVNIEDVDDPVFSQKMVGDGVAINPENNEVVSPTDGQVIQVFDTKHAVGIMAKNGAEILIHIGLETVKLKGKGFKTLVKPGDKVKAGQVLITFDYKYLAENAKSLVTPVVITNTEEMELIEKIACENVKPQDTIMKLTKK
ncbi:PTS glucose transporter subunit IIA [Proteinivorax hydrogeniformans]|uniref:PTS glucose transporter subunit IIA n=1 Tax=Proteinivorax hydrogeniformans TaxID=1826727 RepID=A0AAU8HSW3_9FIRM